MVLKKKFNTICFYEYYYSFEVEMTTAESCLTSMDSIAVCEPLWILKNFD
jgi:hypothetical protein